MTKSMSKATFSNMCADDIMVSETLIVMTCLLKKKVMVLNRQDFSFIYEYTLKTVNASQTADFLNFAVNNRVQNRYLNIISR